MRWGQETVMPCRPRVFVDGAFYHVYCRFAHGARVFAAPEEAERFLAIVREVKRTDELSILAWCLMRTHYHLAVRTGRLPLWRSLRMIQGRFALVHNRRHKTLWPGLTVFLTDPRVPLDNNAAEWALRGVVVGRKNHYGSHSKRGAEVAALFYTLFETAKLAGVDLDAYVLEATRRAIASPGAATLLEDLT